jgi:hypothetical protein
MQLLEYIKIVLYKHCSKHQHKIYRWKHIPSDVKLFIYQVSKTNMHCCGLLSLCHLVHQMHCIENMIKLPHYITLFTIHLHFQNYIFCVIQIKTLFHKNKEPLWSNLHVCYENLIWCYVVFQESKEMDHTQRKDV